MILTLRSGGKLSPRTVTVSPFLAIELRVRNADAAAHTVTIGPATLTVRPGSTGEKHLKGLKAASYPVLVDGQTGGALAVSDAAVGP